MLTALILSALAFIPDSSRVTGYCFDVADQRGLNCSVATAFNNSQQTIQAKQTEQFAFNLPDSARHLIFEAPGFETRKIAVNKVGSNEGNSTFNIKVPMLANGLDPAIKEDETLFSKSVVVLNVEAPDTLTIPIVFQDESGRKLFEHRPVISTPALRHLTLNYMLPGPYSLAMGLFDKHDKTRADIHVSQDITIIAGFNFVKVRYGKPSSNHHGSIATLRPRTLYFDQSSYKLRLESKLVLDSVCATMAKRHTIMAQITGHTDNVGHANLNLILSEYRARVVQHYMKQNGVRPGQISIDWKGGNSPIALNDSEQNKARNRRVELRFVDGR